MTKRKPATPKPVPPQPEPQETLMYEGLSFKPFKLSKRAMDYASKLIAAGIVRGTNRFLVAGCTVLQQDYGFTDQMIIEFAVKTRELGNKYLRIAPNGKNEVETVDNSSEGHEG